MYPEREVSVIGWRVIVHILCKSNDTISPTHGEECCMRVTGHREVGQCVFCLWVCCHNCHSDCCSYWVILCDCTCVHTLRKYWSIVIEVLTKK